MAVCRQFFEPVCWRARQLCALMLCVSLAGPALSKDDSTAPDPQVREKIVQAIGELKADTEVGAISASPIAGLYQVLIGADVLYFSGDGRYVLRGELYDLKEQNNITGDMVAEVREQRLLALGPKDYIEFAAKKGQHTIYVFTDTDCGYCRAMHAKIGDYNRLGVSFRYLAYPRNGLTTDTAGTMRNIWCSEDRQEALSLAKLGRPVAAKACANPVAEQFQLGQELGVSGTPAVFSDTGRYLGGYVPPKELLAALEELNGN